MMVWRFFCIYNVFSFCQQPNFECSIILVTFGLSKMLSILIYILMKSDFGVYKKKKWHESFQAFDTIIQRTNETVPLFHVGVDPLEVWHPLEEG